MKKKIFKNIWKFEKFLIVKSKVYRELPIIIGK